MTRTPTDRRSDDPGVPEALPRTLAELPARLGVENVDRLWIFPPLRRGRKERGLVVVSLHLETEERRRLLTVTYSAERSGLKLDRDVAVTEEGDAPPDLIPRVMEGVVRRAGEQHTDARDVRIDRSTERFDALLEEFDRELFEPETP